MPTALVDEERKPKLRSERPESKGFHEKTDTGRRREGARCDDAARERRRLGTDMAGGGGEQISAGTRDGSGGGSGATACGSQGGMWPWRRDGEYGWERWRKGRRSWLHEQVAVQGSLDLDPTVDIH
jgi:hypothetical protein